MEHSSAKHYMLLVLMAALHLGAMYLLMFSMINTSAEFVHNLNFVYMAGLMTAPMLILEVSLMRKMYANTKMNVLVVVASVLLLTGSFFFIRAQTAIGDEQFLRSMIPHHSGAILMCEKANISDPEIQTLCGEIIESQRQEIEQMQAIRARLGE